MSLIGKESAVVEQNLLISRMSSEIATVCSGSTELALNRIELKIEPVDLLCWLRAQSDRRLVYWSNRDTTFEIAGVGIADQYQQTSKADYSETFKYVRERLGHESRGRYLGGFSFTGGNPPVESGWRSFGAGRFMLPRFEIVRRGHDFFFVCNLFTDEDSPRIQTIFNELKSLCFDLNSSETGEPRFTKQTIHPDLKDWTGIVEAALEQIKKKRLSKVVLSRQSNLEFSSPLNPVAIMHRLSEKAQDCFHYLLPSDNGEQAFVGATPELLFNRQQERLLTEAVAGTRSRGESEEDDQRLGDKLLNSEKELFEHQMVVDSVASSLLPLVESYDQSERALLKLARVQHLRCTFEGRIKGGISDADILRQLHPTAAVGGTPTSEALKLIAELEPCERGWYAAPVGWIGLNESLFAVALRCGLVDGNELTLFSGAGIVDGSKPEAEWKELNKKLFNFTDAISGDAT